MTTAQSPDPAADIINGMHEVASHHDIGRSIFNVFRNTSIGGQIRLGNYYLSRSDTLLHQYHPFLPRKDQEAIGTRIEITVTAKESFDRAHGSIFRRYSLAKEYKRLSKDLFKITETASQRARSQNLLAQFSQAFARSEPPLGTTTVASDPFSDRHGVPIPDDDINVDDLNQMEMTTFQSETTGEAVVILDLQGRDSSTQQVVATVPREAFVVSNETHSESASINSNGDIWGPSRSDTGGDDARL